MLEASHVDVNVAYASVDRHQLQDFEPYIYRTRDSGKSWQPITNGLPRGLYVHTVKEDPKMPGTLFAGTERGAFISINDGDEWQPLQLNLPVTSVRDFEIHDNDLIVGTHGRGIWVIDDISPLRQRNDGAGRRRCASLQADDRRRHGAGGRQRHAVAEGRAACRQPGRRRRHLLLAEDATSAGPVTLEIVDAQRRGGRDDPREAEAECGARRSGGRHQADLAAVGSRAARRRLPTTAGMHRVVWPTIEPGSTDDAATPEERQPRVHTGSVHGAARDRREAVDAGARGHAWRGGQVAHSPDVSDASCRAVRGLPCTRTRLFSNTSATNRRRLRRLHARVVRAHSRAEPSHASATAASGMARHPCSLFINKMLFSY